MRTMLRVQFPVVRSNAAVKDGTLPNTVEGFMKEMKPEVAYFYPEGGKRAALFVFDLPDPTYIVTVAERFFSSLDAEVYMTPVMTAQELKTGIERTMKAAVHA